MIDPTAVDRLNSTDGTQLVCDILRCEAAALGVPAQRVVISSKVTAKDGGVDAKVEDASNDGALLLKGHSYFQIKTGATFKPWRIGDLKKELFRAPKAKPSKQRIGVEVRRCMERKGYYALLSLGHDLLPAQHSQAVENLKKLFNECGYKDAHVDVIGQGQIVGLMQNFPSLCLNFNGLGNATFQRVDSWRANADMQPTLALAEAQTTFIETIRAAWRGNEFQHVRVIGEPGIGKTRLLLEAASADDLSPLTIYVPHAEDFQRSALFNELLKPDRAYTAALVVDECEERERASIWNAIKGRPRLKLITIDHGPETSSDSSMQVHQCPPLGNDQIASILTSYLGRRADVSNWVDWCEGSPRVAHAVGDNLKRNPQDILKSPATVPIWDRFILGHRRLDSTSADEHRLVLKHIALFQRFGFEDPVSNEAQFISRLVHEANPSVTWAKFQSIVRHYQGRRVLQGRHTLFIVPKALHVHLWLGYWNEHGVGFDFESFINRLPDGLRHWFLRLFIYAHATPVAQSVVRKILAQASGPFSQRAFLTSKVGTRFLNYLAEADPPSTLSVIEKTFGQWTLDDLRAWHDGRQDIVWALEKLAVWKDLFPRSANVLSRFALAENATNSNNSKGTFVHLFSIGLGWAATEASPDVRYPVLTRLLKSTDPAERALALELCRQWLSSRGGTRIVGAEYQGLRPTLTFWRPRTYGEMFDCWRKVWRLLRAEIKTWDAAERRRGASVLINSGSELLRFHDLADEVFETLEELADEPATDKEHLTKIVIREIRLRPGKQPKKALSRLKALDRKLTGTSFWDRFSRFVLFTTWDEDYSFKDGTAKPETRTTARVEKLAKEVGRSRATFRANLAGFITSEGHRLAPFGYQLALQKRGAEFDDEVFAALTREWKTAKSDFAGGYLSGIRERDFARWEATILRLLAADETRNLAVNCMHRSGTSARVASELLSLFRNKSVQSRVFTPLGYTARRNGVPQSIVDEVIESLSQSTEEADLAMCIELTHHYYCNDEGQEALTKDPMFRVLDRTLNRGRNRDSTMLDFYWHGVATKFRKTHPEMDLDLLASILKHIDHLPRLGTQGGPNNVADEIIAAQPKAAWPVIAAAIETDQKDRVVQWLDDRTSEASQGVMKSFDPDDVINWISQGGTERVYLMVNGLPTTLNPNEGGTLTQKFIQSFSGIDEVRDEIVYHFTFGGSWRGPRSQHFGRKRDEARYWLSEIKSPHVQTWLLRYIEILSERIESARIEEERM